MKDFRQPPTTSTPLQPTTTTKLCYTTNSYSGLYRVGKGSLSVQYGSTLGDGPDANLKTGQILGSASTATMVGWPSAALRAGAIVCDGCHSPIEVTRRAFVMKPEPISPHLFSSRAF